MFIHVIRGATAGLAATALIGTTFAIFAREWVAVLFGACALGIFIGIARLVWSTSNQPLVDPGKSQLGPFHTLSGKLLLGLLAAGAVVGGALTVAVDAIPSARLAGYGPAALGYGLYGFIAVGLWDATRRHRVEFARLKGAFPDSAKIWKSLTVVIPLLLFSYGTIWVVYYPLSIFSPELVDILLFQDNLFARSAEGAIEIGPNVVSAFALIVVAPIVEEVFFRGFLLHRWALTWGVRSSVVSTTVIFASMHADPLGALLFGFVMAVIYLKTRSLGLVIACHILNNLIAYATGVVHALTKETNITYTVMDFQAEWWMAALALTLSLPWAVRFVRNSWPDDGWDLPYQTTPHSPLPTPQSTAD